MDTKELLDVSGNFEDIDILHINAMLKNTGFA